MARLDTTTASAAGYRSASRPDTLVVRIVLAAAAETRRIPVEVRRRRARRVDHQILGDAVVVHVRLVPLVPALVAQRLLQHPHKVLMRGEQVVVVVQLGRVRHVVGHEVVPPADGAGEPLLGSSPGEVHQTLDGQDVLLPLGDAEVGPFPTHGRVLERAVVVGPRRDLLRYKGFHLGPGRDLDLVDYIDGVDGIAYSVFRFPISISSVGRSANGWVRTRRFLLSIEDDNGALTP